MNPELPSSQSGFTTTPVSSPVSLWRGMARRLWRPALLLLLFLGILTIVYLLTPIRPVRVLPLSEGGSPDFCFSPDGSKLAVAISGISQYGPIQMFDVSSGGELFSIPSASWQFANPFSPDGRYFAILRSSADIQILTADKGVEIASIHVNPFGGGINRPRFLFSPDSKVLAYDAVASAEIAFWDIEGAKSSASIKADFDTFKFGPDGRTAVTHRKGESSVEVEIWHVSLKETPSAAKNLIIRSDWIAVSPDLKTIAALEDHLNPEGREILLWDLDSGATRARIDLSKEEKVWRNLWFEGNGRILLASAPEFEGKRVALIGNQAADLPPKRLTKVWDVSSTPRAIGEYRGHLEVSSDGKWLVPPLDRGAQLISTSSGVTPVNLVNANDQPWWVSFSQDCRTVGIQQWRLDPYRPFFADWPLVKMLPFEFKPSYGFRLWDVESGRELHAFENCYKFEFSPDNKYIATNGPDNTILLWSLPLRKPTGLILLWTALIWLGVVGGVWVLRKAWRIVWARQTSPNRG